MSDDKITGVATSTVSALQRTPVLLVVVLLNVAFLGVAAYYLKIQQDSVTKLVTQMFDRCLPVHP